jgi:hypothetical protein
MERTITPGIIKLGEAEIRRKLACLEEIVGGSQVFSVMVAMF